MIGIWYDHNVLTEVEKLTSVQTIPGFDIHYAPFARSMIQGLSFFLSFFLDMVLCSQAQHPKGVFVLYTTQGTFSLSIRKLPN